MTDLIGCAAVGAIVGFVYGWRRQKAGYAGAISILELPGLDHATRRRGIAEQRGRRIGVSLFCALIGAAANLLLCGIVMLLLSAAS
jgi:hypothetical protein